MRFKAISSLLVFLFLFNISLYCVIPECDNFENDEGDRTGEWVLLFDGDFYEYWDDETPDYYGIITYDNGEITNPLKMYYPSGNLYFETEVWDTNPIEMADGEVTFYWESGKVQCKLNYKAGIKNGSCQYMNADGILMQKGQYYNGLIDGDWEEYYDDTTRGVGKLETEDIKTGMWQYFYNDGKKQAQGWWSDGKRQQDWTFYTINGEVVFNGNYKDDVQDGNWTQYYSDSSYGIGPMKDFKKYGEWRLYSSGGIQTMSGNFVDDKQEGIWNVYDSNGHFSDTIKYAAGVQVNK